ncbi:ATPase, AAA-type, core [Artemisia annua]|uniref:ATPase, AAA-type, core n=1 Tax=Artemisia annua TaxID=35608 RepID=A0A2U1NAC5_ARTAN|nr:ATPase, AAA-type, core [Artemisia annua]
MGIFRTKEDDVSKISISIFVSNFPESFSAKDLFHVCKQYGHVVDSFIPTKRAKDGKRFGFVRFINVFSIERLVNNLCTIWVGHLKLNANVARFNRENLKRTSNVDKTTKTFNKSSLNSFHKTDGNKGIGNSFVNVVKGSGIHLETESTPSIALDDECLNTKDLSCSLMGRVKEFASLANLKKVLCNEGFDVLKISYLGELWVLLEFESTKVKDLFKDNSGVNSWFSVLNQASEDFAPEGRIAWVDVEGIPFKLWSDKTFNRIALKWGKLLEFDDEKYFHSKRICILTKVHQNILENFKIVFRGKIYWLRAIEVPGWTPEFTEEEEEDVVSVDNNHGEIHSDQDINNGNIESDVDEVPETVFDGPEGQKDNRSEDPFEIYSLLNKDTNFKEDKINEEDPSLEYPPGFTPEGNLNEQNSEEVRAKMVNEEDAGDDNSFVHTDGDKENSGSVNMKSDSMGSCRFKKSGTPQTLTQSQPFISIMSTPTSTESKIALAKSIVSTIGSVAAAAMVVRSVSRDYLPPEIQDYFYFGLRNFINKLSRQLTMVIYEYDGFRENEIYNATELYLASRISTDIHRMKITKNANEKNINVSMEINEEFNDVYKGVNFKWSLVSKKTPTREYYNHDDMSSTSRSDQRYLELMFHRKHKDLAINEYLPFILDDAKTRKQEEKTVKLFTVDTKMVYSSHPTVWTSVNLDHPANFTTLAMDSDVKDKVMKDLDRFVERRDYYRKVGKAWKRGYLLYGPPGTGKSSLIAAMANYLNFDIYDLELTDIRSNSELRRLLVATGNRSILVVEDIDCSVEFHDRADVAAARALARENRRRGYQEEQKVTLSGFLNFIDGLWSSCGDERIIIFTTNRKDKLDPALLRPGRMDVHINMSYCTPCGFRLLASNYLGITEHKLFEEIEDLIREVEITPAEVAEQLLKDDDPDIALGGLIEFFDVKRVENEEAKVKAKELEELAAKESEENRESEKTETEIELI